MRRVLSLLMTLCLLLSGCAAPKEAEKTQFTATFLDLFDTVTTVIGRAESEAAFEEKAHAVRDALRRYHELFDVYNTYEGVSNIKTVNDNAGVAPVAVDRAVIDLLLDCRDYYRLTDGKVNVMMGSVLKLWHDARADAEYNPAQAALPSAAALAGAAAHTAMDSLVIDEAKGTVFITDAKARLDVGAVAKGWATQRVAEAAETGLLISVGGNVCATGPKAEGVPWVVGIQDPDDASRNLCALRLTTGSIVTSGDYQRTYRVDGKDYHHIIDPETRMPSTLWQSVSIVCADSGLADALSTGLFLMNREDGERLAAQCGAEVLWVAPDRTEYKTAGFDALLKT